MTDASHVKVPVPVCAKLHLNSYFFYCSLFMLLLCLSRPSIYLETCKPKLIEWASLSLEVLAKANRQNQILAGGLSHQSWLF